MRCFFGLDPSPKTKLAIEQWREKYLPPLARPVAPANYHITLCFLGTVSPHQLDKLTQLADEAEPLAPIELTLDIQGYWRKPSIVWMGCDKPPAGLPTLVTRCRQIAAQSSLQVDEREYVPHVTLYRHQKQPPPPALLAPSISCRFDRFHLFESVTSRHGVQYISRFSWPLVMSLNPRKRSINQ